MAENGTQPAGEAPLRLPPVEHHPLPGSGIDLAVCERRTLPLVAVRLEVWAGAAYDPPKKAGLTEFMVQLLRRGTKKRTAEQIDAAIERVGGSLGLDVDPDSVALSVSLPSEHLKAALEVIADLATSPAFPPKEVEAARRRALAALATDLDDPSTVADKASSHFLLGEHPYGHPLGGWVHTVKTFTRKDVVAQHAALFRPERARLFVVGDVDPAEAVRLAGAAFKGWKGAGPALPELPPLPSLDGARVVLVDKPDATQCQLRLCTPAIRRGHEDYFPVTVASSVLGGGFTSRLMEEIRVNRGLSYGVSSRLYPYRHGGEFVISTFTKNETVREAVEVCLQACRAFADQGPTAEELTRTATYLNGLYPLQLETNEQLARVLADVALYELGDDYVPQFRDRVRRVTAAAAQAAARSHFPHDRYTLVAVGKAKQVKSQLAGFGKLKVVPLAELE